MFSDGKINQKNFSFDSTSSTATSTIFTVSELTISIKNKLESTFPKVTVQGEVSNSKLHSSGHLYFDLKDAQAKMPAVLFRAATDKVPKEGDLIVVTGALSVYPPHGKYQLLVRSWEPMGLGQLLLKLEQLKKKLSEKGWFAKEKKKLLPKFPSRIGVVTSPTGAVIRDIIHVLTRRSRGFHLILNPVRVQGAQAALEIAQAIQQFNQMDAVDVIIVGRGGGSLEDLWAFNEECVAAAIFESHIPIISAVGHETDVTLADYVADVRAATPSAAAEIVSAETWQFLEALNKLRQQTTRALTHQLTHYRALLTGITRHPLLSTSYSLFSPYLQKLDEIKLLLDQRMQQELTKKYYLLKAREKQAHALKPSNQLQHFKQKLIQIERRIEESMQHIIKYKLQGMTKILAQLKGLDPKNVLKRGYCILFALNEGSVIVSNQQLISGKKVQALLADGKAQLTVDHE